MRGTYETHDYGDVILPLVVLRRLDQALADTREVVRDRDADLAAQGVENREPVLRATSKRSDDNTSPLHFDRLLDDEDNVPANLRAWIEGFSPNARDVIDTFGFDTRSDKRAASGLLDPVLARFMDLDLHPNRVSNMDRGCTPAPPPPRPSKPSSVKSSPPPWSRPEFAFHSLQSGSSSCHSGHVRS